MSYIRHNQSGKYVDIPHGSNCYIYDSGRDISGWSHGEFAALIGEVVDEIDLPEAEAAEIKRGFRDHFDGWDPDYRDGINPPERGEIFCQCVDSRIESLCLSDELRDSVQEWVSNFDALRECDHCGEELRPYIYREPYVCGSDECDIKNEADMLGLTVEQARKAETFDDFDEEWAYIVEHSDREDLEE
jgi:hypothetical protein